MHVVERLLEPHQDVLKTYKKALGAKNPNREVAKILAHPIYKRLWPTLRYKGAPTPCLRNLKIVDRDYSNCDLSHMDLRRAEFTGCSFGGAQLTYSTATRAIFNKCNLVDVSAENGHFYGMRIINTPVLNGIYTGSDTRMTPALPQYSPGKKPPIRYVTMLELLSLPTSSKPAILVGPRRAEYAKQFGKYLASFDGVHLADHAHLHDAVSRHPNLHLIYLFEVWDNYLPEPALGYNTVECIYHPEAPNNRLTRSDKGLPRKV